MAAKRQLDLDTPKKENEAPAKKTNIDRDDTRDTRQADGLGDEASPTPPIWFALYLEKFYQLERRIDTLVIKRIEEQEEKLKACCIQVDEVVKEVKKLKEEKKEILLKLDDLENRSRRSNLVLHGVAEIKRENCLETVTSFITDYVGVPQSDYGVERCHRTPTVPRQTTASAGEATKPTPRIIHIAFSSFAAKERVRKACIAKLKKENDFRDGKVFVSEDFSHRVLQMRKEKMDVLKKLKDENKRPFFLYPAKLAYRNKDGKLVFV